MRLSVKKWYSDCSKKTTRPKNNQSGVFLYMVKAIRYVKDAFINSGSGIMDFAEDVKALRPDIFFVNSDGYTPEKKKFCEENGIELVVSQRIPEAGLHARSTTALRQECKIVQKWWEVWKDGYWE